MSIEASEDELAIQVSSIPAPDLSGADRSRDELKRSEYRSGASEQSNLEVSGMWNNESKKEAGKRSTVRDP